MASDIPEPNPYDHYISTGQGETMVSGLLSSRLRSQKKPKDHGRVRYEDLLRDIGALRSELVFYRTCFEHGARLCEDTYEVSKQLLLMYYFKPLGTSGEHEEAHRLALELQDAVDRFHTGAILAEEEWLSFWGISRAGVGLIEGRI